jgi:hypothetical protein
MAARWFLWPDVFFFARRDDSSSRSEALESTVCLLLFLFGVYEGVKDGVTRYVHTADADLWIWQKNANNC